MPSQLRKNKQGLIIANSILNTPKDQQQKPDKKPSDKRVQQWLSDAFISP